MNEEQLKALFERQSRLEQEVELKKESVRVDPVAKKRAIAAAMKEFDIARDAQQKNNFSFSAKLPLKRGNFHSLHCFAFFFC